MENLYSNKQHFQNNNNNEKDACDKCKVIDTDTSHIYNCDNFEYRKTFDKCEESFPILSQETCNICHTYIGSHPAHLDIHHSDNKNNQSSRNQSSRNQSSRNQSSKYIYLILLFLAIIVLVLKFIKKKKITY